MIENAALPGCKVNCAKLLEKAKANSTVELDAARPAIAGFPAIKSTSPLADRFGWSPTTLDLVIAMIGSLAANGPGSVLIAYGAHTPKLATIENEPAIERRGVSGKASGRRSHAPRRRRGAAERAARRAASGLARRRPHSDRQATQLPGLGAA